MTEIPRLPPERRPLVEDVSDEEQVARARAAEVRRRQREMEELGVVLSTREGRAFVWRQLAPAFRLSFAGEAPLTTAFNEGIRSQANYILAEVNDYWPHRYLEMMTESRSNLASGGESAK